MNKLTPILAILILAGAGVLAYFFVLHDAPVPDPVPEVPLEEETHPDEAWATDFQWQDIQLSFTQEWRGLDMGTYLELVSEDESLVTIEFDGLTHFATGAMATHEDLQIAGTTFSHYSIYAGPSDEYDTEHVLVSQNWETPAYIVLFGDDLTRHPFVTQLLSIQAPQVEPVSVTWQGYTFDLPQGYSACESEGELFVEDAYAETATWFEECPFLNEQFTHGPVTDLIVRLAEIESFDEWHFITDMSTEPDEDGNYLIARETVDLSEWGDYEFVSYHSNMIIIGQTDMYLVRPTEGGSLYFVDRTQSELTSFILDQITQ